MASEGQATDGRQIIGDCVSSRGEGMKIVRVTAVSGASARTRNRLREHGPVFKLVREDKPICFAGVRCVFVRSGDWFGWLPINEIEVINESR